MKHGGPGGSRGKPEPGYGQFGWRFGCRWRAQQEWFGSPDNRRGCFCVHPGSRSGQPKFGDPGGGHHGGHDRRRYHCGRRRRSYQPAT